MKTAPAPRLRLSTLTIAWLAHARVPLVAASAPDRFRRPSRPYLPAHAQPQATHPRYIRHSPPRARDESRKPDAECLPVWAGDDAHGLQTFHRIEPLHYENRLCYEFPQTYP